MCSQITALGYVWSHKICCDICCTTLTSTHTCDMNAVTVLCRMALATQIGLVTVIICYCSLSWSVMYNVNGSQCKRNLKAAIPWSTVQVFSPRSMSATLPPLQNLPQWPRVHNLDRARYPKPFLKDRLRPLPDPGHVSGDGGFEDEPLSSGRNGSDRIQVLENNIIFLRMEHEHMLAALHAEVDRLKRENQGKEQCPRNLFFHFTFQLFMVQSLSVQKIMLLSCIMCSYHRRVNI